MATKSASTKLTENTIDRMPKQIDFSPKAHTELRTRERLTIAQKAKTKRETIFQFFA